MNLRTWSIRFSSTLGDWSLVFLWLALKNHLSLNPVAHRSTNCRCDLYWDNFYMLFLIHQLLILLSRLLDLILSFFLLWSFPHCKFLSISCKFGLESLLLLNFLPLLLFLQNLPHVDLLLQHFLEILLLFLLPFVLCLRNLCESVHWTRYGGPRVLEGFFEWLDSTTSSFLLIVDNETLIHSVIHYTGGWANRALQIKNFERCQLRLGSYKLLGLLDLKEASILVSYLVRIEHSWLTGKHPSCLRIGENSLVRVER